MKLWIHKDSKLDEFLDDFCLYETVEDLEKLPDDTVQIIPLDRKWVNYIKEHQSKNIVIEHIVEGSNTFVRHLDETGLLKGALEGRYATICSGCMPESIKNCNIQYLMYLTGLKNEHQKYISFSRHERPYTFLYLNNRLREHRTALINEIAKLDLLDDALWSHISSGKSLPSKYDQHREVTFDTLVDWDIWLSGLMVPEQHFDTYFSVQAESTVKMRYSLFSEKTWKPILGEHPFITLSGQNHYKDLKVMGFETFDNVFGNDWHDLERWQDRMKGMVENIDKVVGPDLHDIMFDSETRQQCWHNQRHFWAWFDEYKTSAKDKISCFLEEHYPNAEVWENRWKPNASYALKL